MSQKVYSEFVELLSFDRPEEITFWLFRNSRSLMYFVYVIENLKKNLYIGWTDNVENCLKEHQRGETYTTKR